MPNFTISLKPNTNQVISIAAASKADYIQLVKDYASSTVDCYLDQYDIDSLADALLDASEPWLEFDECEQLYMSLNLA